MQRVFENKRTRYIWKFPDLGLSYCEIPKTGSSSTKSVLFRLNYKLSAEDELKVGSGQLVSAFPNSVVRKYEADDFLNRVLIVYRDPVMRAKSAYRGIFLRRQGLLGTISEYLEKYLPEYLASESTDGLLNHHKPMTWFFPQFLIKDSRSIFIETSDLNSLPERFGFDMGQIPTKGETMPHMLNMNKNLGDVDMSDDEIKAALGPDFDNDFMLYENLKAKNTGG